MHYRNIYIVTTPISTSHNRCFIALCIPSCTHTHTLTVIEVAIPFFDGEFSFLQYPPLASAFISNSLYIEFRPQSPDGLILYNGQIDGPDFIALLLRGGQVEFWYDLGSGVATIVSDTVLALDQWHSIEANRTGMMGSLIVNGQFPSFGSSAGTFTMLQINQPLLIGGAPDLTAISYQLSLYSGFNGCIRELRSFGSPYELITDAEFGRGISECSVPACERISCLNGGVCVETGNTTAMCQCPIEFTGQFCETELCASSPCENNGECFVGLDADGVAAVQCECSLPFAGDEFCTASECICSLSWENCCL